jgi:hypothetical protein
MDEVWARIVLIAGVLAVAGGVALLRRRSSRRPVRDIEARGWSAGVYFFSSATCPTCDSAREKLDAQLGEAGYTEFSWERDSGRFRELAVDAVPSVAVVDESGKGRLYPGQPGRALARL